MFPKYFRFISAIVLFFFLWTFGGLFDIAYAIQNSSQHTVDSSQGNLVRNSQPSKDKKPEEKFQKTIEDIENILVDAVTDTDTKKAKVKIKKKDIEALDKEIRKQFAKTEKKLKDAKLPDEILQRHYKFVRHYQDNLNQLRTNLNNIDKAKTKYQIEKEIERTKAFLGRVKPPKKHVPLDPNKLPHRTAEPGEVKLEELSTSQAKALEREYAQLGNSTFKEQSAMSHEQREPILVASIGSLAGILSQAISQAIAPPTASDLAETVEVQFTPEIKAKAAELNYNPVKIYNWVRNNIEFVPTYGSIQGADMCLQTKQCNDFDTASLLIALLRASNIPAKYVYGTIELPIEKVMNWTGGFTDPMSALNRVFA